MEVEKLQAAHVQPDSISESGSLTNDTSDAGDRLAEPNSSKYFAHGSREVRVSNPKYNSVDAKEPHQNGSNAMMGCLPDSDSFDVSWRSFVS